jgi:hypothetical protein
LAELTGSMSYKDTASCILIATQAQPPSPTAVPRSTCIEFFA